MGWGASQDATEVFVCPWRFSNSVEGSQVKIVKGNSFEMDLNLTLVIQPSLLVKLGTLFTMNLGFGSELL